MNNIRVLHITAHLGGGIGRALSQLARYRQTAESDVDDAFVCLEPPSNTRYADAITGAGAGLSVAPTPQELDELVASADIVQLEWWHHPLLAGLMGRWSNLPMRLIVWAHISGLHYPAIPPAFTHLPHAFLLTSNVSQEHLNTRRKNILQVVNSSGGFDDLPCPKRPAGTQLKFGYIGTLNPSKLNPEIKRYLDAVKEPMFSVDFYGDLSPNPHLEMAAKAGPAPRVVLRGYTNDPGSVLSGMDVLVYLLNPTHYGTTENALLEAMACGVVPVVLNNPVESSIVEHGRTGLVVDSPASFAEAVSYLSHNPSERLRLSAAASATVRQQYSVRNCAEQLDSVYRQVMNQPKRVPRFEDVFGHSPADWFISCLGTYSNCLGEGAEDSAREKRLRHPFFYEKTKSSAFHFASYFPTDMQLAQWTSVLEADVAVPRA